MSSSPAVGARLAPVAPPPAPAAVWPLWRRLLFRFTAAYLLLFLLSSVVAPLADVPGLGKLIERFFGASDGLSAWVNDHLFHIRHQTVQPDGNGDTTFEYGTLCLNTLLAAVGAVGWSVFDRHRRAYPHFAYWLLVALRYFVASVAFGYGIVKLFGQQMVFPSLSALATPLGDLLPMRLAWYFIGYSAPYQFFSGLVEVLAGGLLLWRRTATLGAVVATGVFLNVLLLNLCYDVPVKVFATHLFVFSGLLLLADGRRLFDFFVLNRPTAPRWEPLFVGRRARWARYAVKVVFIGLFGVLPVVQGFMWRAPGGAKANAPRLPAGVYEVTGCRPALPDSLRWHDVILEADGRTGSIRTADHRLRQRYRRGYFAYTLDSATRTVLTLHRRFTDTATLARFRVSRPDTTCLTLRGRYRGGDSLTVALRRVPRHFQLAERQFHWVSETNR